MASEGTSTSSDKDRMEATQSAVNILAQGKRNMVCGEIPTAVNQFQEACKLLAKAYGETAKECADAYFCYGQALLDLARMENGVLGNALQGVPETDDEKEADQKDEQFEKVEIEVQEREKLRQEVYDAMGEKETEKADRQKKEEKESEKGETMEVAMDTDGKEQEKEVTKLDDKDLKKEKSDEEKEDKKDKEKDEDKDKEKDEAKDKGKVEDKDKGKVEDKDKGKVEDKDIEKVKGMDKEKDDDNDKDKDECKMDVKVDDKNLEDADTKDTKKGDKTEEKDGEKELEEKKVEKEEKKKDDKDIEMKEKKETDTKQCVGRDEDEEEKEGSSEEGDEGTEGEEGTEEEGEEGEAGDAAAEGEDTADNTSQDGSQDGENPDDVSNLQLAWEMLELAKLIYIKDESKEAKLRTAESHLKLGEVSLETEQYEEAIKDFNTCYDIQKANLEADNRLLAETHYQLGLAYCFNKQFTESVDSYRAAIKVIEDRISNLTKVLDAATKEEKESKDFDTPVYKANKEVEDLKEILPDIKAKIEDCEDEKKNMEDLKNLAKEAMGGLTSGSTTEKTAPMEASSSKEEVKTLDISHLIKRKRKSGEDVDEEKVKKLKQDESGDGDSDKKVNGHDKKEDAPKEEAPKEAMDTKS